MEGSAGWPNKNPTTHGAVNPWALITVNPWALITEGGQEKMPSAAHKETRNDPSWQQLPTAHLMSSITAWGMALRAALLYLMYLWMRGVRRKKCVYGSS